MTTKATRAIVSCADVRATARYDHAAEAAGCPGLWVGRARLTVGGVTFEATARGRGPERAQALASREAWDAVLEHFAPRYEP